jgi:hypothetical protein
VILFEYFNVKLYGVFDVLNSGFPGFSLTDTTGQARTFGNPIAVFAGVNDDLAHRIYPSG